MRLISLKRQTKMDPIHLSGEKMRRHGIEAPIVDLFAHYYRQVLEGTDGLLREDELKPVADHNLVTYEDLSGFEAFGRSRMQKVARIVLNGGLGTTMGLTTPKSLLTAKNGQTFMDIILHDIRSTNATLCLMNSYYTHKETCRHIGKLKLDRQPFMFFQHQYPKILRHSLLPASWPGDGDLEWNPAGHGDVFNSLHLSGMLNKLVNMGIRYALISNSDNLGATLDPVLLGYFARTGLPFMMEVARRTPSDAKGGHLAMNARGTLVLRESAQCPPEEMDAFQDIHRYRFFNTNNIWIDLEFLKRHIQREGLIRLPIMLNPKPLDPRNESSPPVYQVETAMGSAITLFEGAEAVRVPRHRFLPVKSTNDLLMLRSDRLTLSPDKGLAQSSWLKEKQIRIDLDPKYYKRLDMFEERFSHGAPNLAACNSFTVKGNIFFKEEVTILGNVTISTLGHDRHVIPRKTVIDSDRQL